MKIFSAAVTLLSLGSLQLANGHFILRTPTSIGYLDSTEDQSPCGGFSVTSRSGGVANWPIGGRAIGLTTTHSTQTWEFRFAKLSAPTVWVKTTLPAVTQSGYPYFCEPIIPGVAAWVGEDAILQVIQNTSHGSLYQCAAIKFVAGGAATPPSTGCTNSTTVTASW